ncbi:hypothetical protein HR12_39250 [Microbacterium sp. SUBG005]|nr:hypothetical protein HR12_39250 [Microbacterium sp. SUBG005]
MLDLPLEQLSARISSCLSRSVLRPLGSPRLVSELFRQGAPDDDYRRELLAILRWYARHPHSPRDERLGSESSKNAERVFPRDFGQMWENVQGDVEIYAQDQLDAFQLRVGHEWRRTVSWWSVFAASASGLALAAAISPASVLPVALVSPFVGAFVSWVTRDITAVVERARRR